jgi:hypothetical protein
MTEKVDYIHKFLEAYWDYSGFEEKFVSTDQAVKYLCENQEWGIESHTNRRFGMMVFGWIWGASNDYIEANCLAGLLTYKLDEMYKIVAKENNWD